MAEHTVRFSRSARKELERLPTKLIERIRVGDYRVIYSVEDAAHMVDIVAVGHRRDVYRD